MYIIHTKPYMRKSNEHTLTNLLKVLHRDLDLFNVLFALGELHVDLAAQLNQQAARQVNHELQANNKTPRT